MEWTCYVEKTTSKEDKQAAERAWAFRVGSHSERLPLPVKIL